MPPVSHAGALIIRTGFWGFLLQSSLKGSIRATVRVYQGLGALMIRIGFWGLLYYIYNKEPQKIMLVTIEAPTLVSSCNPCMKAGPSNPVPLNPKPLPPCGKESSTPEERRWIRWALVPLPSMFYVRAFSVRMGSKVCHSIILRGAGGGGYNGILPPLSLQTSVLYVQGL